MNYETKTVQPSITPGGLMGRAWKLRHWWLLPMGVLLLLLSAIYVLEHLSSADSEMYPTSSWAHASVQRSC